MSTKEKLTVKKLINLTAEMMSDVREFRFENRLENDSEAIRVLIQMALDEKKINKNNIRPTMGQISDKPN